MTLWNEPNDPLTWHHIYLCYIYILPLEQKKIIPYPECMLSCFSPVWLCDSFDSTPPGSSIHGFSRQEYWNGLPRPPPGNLPDPGIESAQLLHKTPYSECHHLEILDNFIFEFNKWRLVKQWSTNWGLRYLSTSSHSLLALLGTIIKCRLLTPDLGTAAAPWHQLGPSTDSGKAEAVHRSPTLQDGVQNDWGALHSPCKCCCAPRSTSNGKLQK